VSASGTDLATFIPAWIIASSVGTSQHAGPRVQKILVLRLLGSLLLKIMSRVMFPPRSSGPKDIMDDENVFENGRNWGGGLFGQEIFECVHVGEQEDENEVGKYQILCFSIDNLDQQKHSRVVIKFNREKRRSPFTVHDLPCSVCEGYYFFLFEKDCVPK
jgi:hypothetical protein